MDLIKLFIIGITTMTKIAVIDTGMNTSSPTSRYMCESGHKSFNGDTIEDTNGHGTKVSTILAMETDIHPICIVVVKYNSSGVKNWLTDALDYVTNLDVRYVNISLSGYGSNEEEYQALHRLIDSGKIVSVAAGNDDMNFNKNCNRFPACHRIRNKKFWVVGATDNVGNISEYSNKGSIINAWANGDYEDSHGTSYSSARWTANLVKNRVGQPRR